MTQQSVQYVAQGTEGGGAALDQAIGMSVAAMVSRWPCCGSATFTASVGSRG